MTADPTSCPFCHALLDRVWSVAHRPGCPAVPSGRPTSSRTCPACTGTARVVAVDVASVAVTFRCTDCATTWRETTAPDPEGEPNA